MDTEERVEDNSVRNNSDDEKCIRSVYIPANKNPILKLDGNLNFLKTYPKKDRNTLLYWF